MLSRSDFRRHGRRSCLVVSSLRLELIALFCMPAHLETVPGQPRGDVRWMVRLCRQAHGRPSISTARATTAPARRTEEGGGPQQREGLLGVESERQCIWTGFVCYRTPGTRVRGRGRDVHGNVNSGENLGVATRAPKNCMRSPTGISRLQPMGALRGRPWTSLANQRPLPGFPETVKNAT